MKKKGIRLKSSEEIQRIREAGTIISDIFKSIAAISLEGMSTWDLDSFIEVQINRKRGRPAFKTIIGYDSASCISINNEVVHGIPSKKKIIKDGDIVKIDIGVVLNGYFSDACYTFSIGNVSERAKRLVEVTLEALNRSIAVMYPGNRLGDIGNTIQNYAESHGYTVVHKYSGHGVGFALHELPAVPHYGKKGTGIILEEGMVLAVEPILNEGENSVITQKDGWTTITSDGKLSAQFEHTIAVTRDGPIILTE